MDLRLFASETVLAHSVLSAILLLAVTSNDAQAKFGNVYRHFGTSVSRLGQSTDHTCLAAA